MTVMHVLICSLLLAEPSDKKWEEAAKEDGIVVYARDREGSNLAELKAVGMIDAAPHEVWKAIRDYENYKKTMPYTEESKVLASEKDGKVIDFYSVVNAPLVDRRDYVIRLVDESDWKDGKGFLKVAWSAVPAAAPERKDMIRVKFNDGYWLLEPRESGKKTFTTYYVFTDPGGSLPRWIANKANSSAVPNVFKAVRKQVSKPR